MAGIEPVGGPAAGSSTGREPALPPIRPLGTDDLPGALQLTRAAAWNQNEADWRMMLELGRGWGIDTVGDDARTQLAASIVVLPYGDAFAWVSMVLVSPAFRGRGYAQQLLRHALGALASNGLGGVLDATPAGYPVYVQEGFVDSWGFRRYRRDPAFPTPTRIERTPNRASRGTAAASFTVRAVDEKDWPAIAALDLPAFGADRTPLLRRLAQRLPHAAHVAELDGAIVGFVLGRDGREAAHVGPLVAADAAAAYALLDAALAPLGGPVYVDATDAQPQLLAAIAEHGFVLQRPFTRMLCALDRAPGDASKVFLVAGPELG